MSEVNYICGASLLSNAGHVMIWTRSRHDSEIKLQNLQMMATRPELIEGIMNA